jgi:hypothetical protein
MCPVGDLGLEPQGLFVRRANEGTKVEVSSLDFEVKIDNLGNGAEGPAMGINGIPDCVVEGVLENLQGHTKLANGRHIIMVEKTASVLFNQKILNKISL